MAPQTILIIGCGIAGSTLASLLLSQDPSTISPTQLPHITILERAPSIRAEGQNIDIRGSGLTIIRKLGLETAIRSSTTGEEGVKFVDSSDHVWAAFGADRSGEISTPTADIEILRGRLAEILWRRSQAVSEDVVANGGQGIEYIFGDFLNKIEQEGDRVRVKFARSGATKWYDLVVGADGLQSRTRQLAWGADGEDEKLKKLGMYGAFFSMPAAPTDSLWRRWYHAPGGRAIMLRPSGKEGTTTVFMYVITDRDERLVEVASDGHKGVVAQKKLMAEYFEGVGWESERVVKEMMATKDFYYDLIGQVKMDSWSKGRVVLLGDAGYCGSPVSGMGTTLALNGAYHLAGALTQHPDDYTAAFTQYDQKMRPLVDDAHKLAPGQFLVMGPQTIWGIFVLRLWVGALYWSGLFNLVARFAGRGDNATAVEDYGFQQLSELTNI